MPWHRNLHTQEMPSYKRSQRLGVTEGGVLNNWLGSSANDTVVAVINTLYALPIFLPETIRVAMISCEVTTGSAGNIRLGLYTDSNGYPTTRLFVATEITTASAAGIKTQAVGLTLPAGFYWATSVFSSTPTMRADTISGGNFWLGHTDMNDTVGHTGISVAFTYDALPATFTAGGLLLTTDTPRVLVTIGKYGVLP